MNARSVIHTSFVVERRLPAPPAAVFRAWSDPEAKRRWSACHAGTEHHLDFRVGGSETSRVAMPDGTLYVVEARFLDIVADARILYAFSMRRGDTPLSASLVTVVFEPEGAGTRMVFTEQVAFLDGHQDPAERIRGTEDGLDRLRLALPGAA